MTATEAIIGSIIHGLVKGSVQAQKASRPASRVNERRCVNEETTSSKNITPKREWTTSKASSLVNESTSAAANVTASSSLVAMA